MGVAVGQALHHKLLVFLGAAHFHNFGHHIGILGRQVGQQVAPAFQLGNDFRRVQVVNLLAPPLAERLFDDGIGEVGLHVVGLLHPLRPRHGAHEGAVVAQGGLVQALVVGVVRAEVLEVADGKLAAEQEGQHPVALKEGNVAVFGHGNVVAVAVLALELGPAPLVLVAVPVAYPHVEQAGAGKSLLVDAVVVVFQQALQQLVGAHQVFGVAQAGHVALVVFGVFFQGRGQVRERAVVLAQQGVLGHVHRHRVGVQNARRRCQRRQHKRSIRMLGRHLVLQHVLGKAGAQSFGQHGGGVLVDAAQREVVAGVVAHLQRGGLLAAAGFVGHQAAPVGGQVQQRETYRRGPLLAVVLAQQPVVEAAVPVVARVHGHQHAAVAEVAAGRGQGRSRGGGALFLLLLLLLGRRHGRGGGAGHVARGFGVERGAEHPPGAVAVAFGHEVFGPHLPVVVVVHAGKAFLFVGKQGPAAVAGLHVLGFAARAAHDEVRGAFLEILQVVLVPASVDEVGVLVENLHQPLLVGLVSGVSQVLADAAVLARKRVDGPQNGQRHKRVLVHDAERENVVAEREVAAVHAVAEERVVAHHHDVLVLVAGNDVVELAHEVGLVIDAAAAARAVGALVAAGQEPLRVDGNQQQVILQADFVGAGAAVAGRDEVAGVGERGRVAGQVILGVALFAQHLLEAARQALLPVVVARNHVLLALVALQHVHLVAQAALRVLAVVGAFLGHPVLVNVVAEVDGGAFGAGGQDLLAQEVQRRLAAVGRGYGFAHVANQKHRVANAGAVGRQLGFPAQAAAAVVGARVMGVLARLALGQRTGGKGKHRAQQQNRRGMKAKQ